MEKIKLPESFISVLNAALPKEDVGSLIEAIHGEPSISVRLNPKKGQNIIDSLVLKSVPFSQHTKILKERPLFTADPGLHAGAYYVQESSSSIVGEIVSLLLEKSEETGSVVLDLCAAPGGKSTHVSSVLKQGDLLVANEVIQSRTPILIENLTKWGDGNFVVTSTDAKNLGKMESLFSIIVADMPCSGEGMFRKDPKSIEEWSIQNVALCCGRQQRIAFDIWPSLKEGGYFIYSTCTYNRQENEENVELICGELGGKAIIFDFPKDWPIYSDTEGMYRLLPHLNDGEGFFFSVIQKTSESDVYASPKKMKQPNVTAFPEELQKIKNDWIGHGEGNYFSIVRGGDWHKHHPLLLQLLPGIKQVGVNIGMLDHKTWKPSAAFDLLSNIGTYYEKIDVEIDTALTYYKREFVAKKLDKKGVVGLRWNALQLGTGNAVNNGINNLWPMNWRVLQKNMEAKTILAVRTSEELSED